MSLSDSDKALSTSPHCQTERVDVDILGIRRPMPAVMLVIRRDDTFVVNIKRGLEPGRRCALQDHPSLLGESRGDRSHTRPTGHFEIEGLLRPCRRRHHSDKAGPHSLQHAFASARPSIPFHRCLLKWVPSNNFDGTVHFGMGLRPNLARCDDEIVRSGTCACRPYTSISEMCRQPRGLTDTGASQAVEALSYVTPTGASNPRQALPVKSLDLNFGSVDLPRLWSSR